MLFLSRLDLSGLLELLTLPLLLPHANEHTQSVLGGHS